MNELINDSLKYPLRSDAFLRIMAIGGIFSFVEYIALNTFLNTFVTVATPVVLSDPFLDGATLAVQRELMTPVGLIALGIVSFIVISGFRVRVVKRVISGEESPPGFADSKQLLFNGVLFCLTSLALIVVLFTIAQIFILIYAFSVVVVLGIPPTNMVAVLIGIVFAVLIVYPIPSSYIIIARFQQRADAGRSYFWFVISRKYVSELRSILLSREYVVSWGALIVVSIMYGAASPFYQEIIVNINQPIKLIIGLNSRFAFAVLGFYADVAVMFIYGTLFRNQGQQTSLLDF